MTPHAASPLRHAELLASIALATDLAMGQPLGQAWRTCLISVELARELGAGPRALRDVHHVALTRFIACTADARDLAHVFFDEISARAAMRTVDFTSAREALGAMIRHVGAGEPIVKRARRLVSAFVRMPSLFGLGAVHCEVTSDLGPRLALEPSVVRAIEHLLERWDGKGMPRRLAKDRIDFAARVVQVAQDGEALCRSGGEALAREVLRRRSGRAYDPDAVDVFLRRLEDLRSVLDGGGDLEQVLAAEPAPARTLTDEALDTALEAVADFADLKSRFTAGHSRGVAALARKGALVLGLGDGAARTVWRAALLHDLGRVGVSNAVWDKPRPLGLAEWERVRLHTYFTERILARPASLSTLAEIASSAHERADGGGYHRRPTTIPIAAHLLAAADVYEAMLAERPHRRARTAEAAREELRRAAREGLIERAAAEAVLEAAGHARRGAREAASALSAREREVLERLARGRSDKEIARDLGISPRTASHHVQHIYRKIGVSTRAAATLYAVRRGLVGSAFDD